MRLKLVILSLFLTSTFTYAQDSKESLLDSLLAFYPFNGSIIDATGNENDGEIIGNLELENDRFGTSNAAFKFSGESDYINLFDTFDFENDTTVSFSLWLKPTEFERDMSAFSKRQSGGSFVGYEFWAYDHDPENDITMLFSIDFGATSMVINANKGLILNHWNHVVITRDGSNGKMYLNGQDVTGAIENPANAYFVNTNETFKIGRGRSGNGFVGEIDDFGIYSESLTPSDIDSLYTLGHWPFNYEVNVKDQILFNPSNRISAIELINVELEDSISAYQFDLEIPDGLTFTGLDTTSTLSSGGTFQTNVIDDTLKVAFSTTEYLAGDSLLVKLQFDAEGSGDFEIAPFNFVLNNMEIDSVTPGILSVVELLGDVDDNDSIQAYDGALALQYSVDIDPIPSIDALPWDNWRVAAADVDRDGSVLALDASYILQKTVGLIDEFPNAAFKSLPIELIVQQDENHLVFATASEGLIGFNASIPTSDVLVFNEPIYSWSESIQAINQKENSLEIGIASHIPASGEFMRIPFAITEEQSFEIEINKNNVTQVIAITLSTDGVEAELVSEKVRSFELGQNYPNPFNPSTNINFSIPQSQYVTLKVYDISGREVATLVDGIRNIGEHTINFDATNLASGVYIYQLISGAQVHTKRMLLIK